MFPVYSIVDLSSKSLSELKAIARQIGAVVVGDLRRKATYAEAIVAHQQAAVKLVELIVDEVVAEREAEFVQQAKSEVDRDFIAEENEIIDQINILSDALNFAILSDSYSADCPGIRKLEEDVDALNFQLQQVADAHREYIQSLCRDVEPVDIWWQGEANGAVSIDGGQTYRCFRVLDMLSDRPVVKLIISKKQEIDSRWATTKNNRYMRAVIEAIPAHIKQLASEIWNDGEIVGYADEEPPNRGDNGRGRVECGSDEWIEF